MAPMARTTAPMATATFVASSIAPLATTTGPMAPAMAMNDRPFWTIVSLLTSDKSEHEPAVTVQSTAGMIVYSLLT